MKRNIFTLLTIISTSLFVQAQNVQTNEMMLFSQNFPISTARSMSLSGAYGALGSDMASLGLNPAGVGFYRSSDLSISLGLSHNTGKSDYKSNSYSDFVEKLNLNSLGYVFSANSMKDEGWVGVSFGIAYNRINDFNSTALIKTNSATSSYLDELCYNANSGQGSPYYEDVAYDANALYADNQGYYISDFTANGNQYGQTQRRILNTSGKIGEWDFSIGANYSHKLYLGATLGIQNIDYTESFKHIEEDPAGIINGLNSFTFNQTTDISGTGYNFKLGAIYKPYSFINIGLAVHSPTFTYLSSTFYTSSDFWGDNPSDDGYSNSPVLVEDYYLSTPWKGIVSLALIDPRIGLISIDYERLNYSSMRLSGDDDTNTSDLAADQNELVKSEFTAANNLKVGAEAKLGAFALRGGVGMYGSPYSSSANQIDPQTMTYSCGFGYKSGNFYIDFAYMRINSQKDYTLYNYLETNTNGNITYPLQPQTSKLEYKQNKFIATVGFRF
jgi:hypothetical protein